MPILHIPTAVPERPPTTLFRFRKFPSLSGLVDEALKQAQAEREHLYDMICNGHVRLARPTSFVDHFDCYAYPVAAHTDPDEQRKAIRSGLNEYLKTLPPEDAERFRSNPRNIEELEKNFPKAAEMTLQHMRNEETSVYCMCEVANRPAMWALYADAGRGVCVQIDTSVPPFDLSQRVIYQEEVAWFPMPIDLNDKQQRDFVIQQMFLVKNTDWKHEREFRFVNSFAMGQDHILAAHQSRVTDLDLYFSPRRILAICIGPSMDTQTALELKTELARRNCLVPIYRSEMSKRQHKVLFKDRI